MEVNDVHLQLPINKTLCLLLWLTDEILRTIQGSGPNSARNCFRHMIQEELESWLASPALHSSDLRPSGRDSTMANTFAFTVYVDLKAASFEGNAKQVKRV